MTTTVETTFRAGFRRGLIEYRNVLQTPSEVTYMLIGLAVTVTVLVLLRDVTVAGIDEPLMLFAFPGVLAMQIVLTGCYSGAVVVSADREDGTLLRLKSAPNGMAAYVVALVVRLLLDVVLGLAVVIVPGTILIAGVWDAGIGGVLAAAGFAVLGALALAPIGVALGTVFRNPRSVGGWGFFVAGGFIALSGLFAPLTVYPEWLQVIAQIFPLYWLGLGLRSALLPDALVAIEIGESWRTVESLGVLGAWAILGLVLAPTLLRRMARRESGSAVERRRQAALQRA